MFQCLSVAGENFAVYRFGFEHIGDPFKTEIGGRRVPVADLVFQSGIISPGSRDGHSREDSTFFSS